MQLRNLTYFFKLMALLILALVLGKTVFVPMAFAIMLAFLMFPMVRILEKKLPRVLSISVVFLGFSLIIGVLVGFYLYWLKNIVTGIDGFDFTLDEVVQKCCGRVAEFLGVDAQSIVDLVHQNMGSFIAEPITFLSTQIMGSTTIFVSLILTFVITFLLLLYRTAFKNFLLYQIDKQRIPEVKGILKDVQKVSQQYLFGLVKIIAILGVLNSLGLWAIGIKYPFFWGFFAAFLTIIPYVGTFIGGFLPFVFAIFTTGTIWQPIAVVALFTAIQFAEDNLIKPKIVGNEVDLNPLVAIVSLIIGGLIWGIPGLVLSLPYMAIFKIVLEQFDETESVAALMSSEIYDKPNVFKEKFSDSKHSVLNLFQSKKNKK